jgi:multidrug/hemolysin transport system ATP-binding protein
MMSIMIEVKDVVKKCRKGVVVNRISFNINQGDLFALLGKAGAGKTAVIYMLCGLAGKDAGEIMIGGQPLGRKNVTVRHKMGIVFQEGVVDKYLTVRENLFVRGGFYNLGKKVLKENIEQLCTLFKMDDFMKKPYGKLSISQKRKVDIARAMIHKPEILLLDEPTAGLDFDSAYMIRSIIGEIRRELGMTICFTTKSMDEAVNADFICVMNKGEIVGRGTPDYLKSKFATDCLKLYGCKPNGMDYLKNHRIQFEIREDVVYILINNVQESLNILNHIHQDIEGYELIKGKNDAFCMQTLGEWVEKDGGANAS